MRSRGRPVTSGCGVMRRTRLPGWWRRAGGRTGARGGGALRAWRGESVVADGFQEPVGMGCAGGSAVGVGRSPPLGDRAARNLVHQSSARKTAADRSVRALRCAGGDADGSRDAVVEQESVDGLDVADAVEHAARNPAALQRVAPSADARESGTLSRRVKRGDAATRNPSACTTAIWLDFVMNIISSGRTKHWR